MHLLGPILQDRSLWVNQTVATVFFSQFSGGLRSFHGIIRESCRFSPMSWRSPIRDPAAPGAFADLLESAP